MKRYVLVLSCVVFLIPVSVAQCVDFLKDEVMQEYMKSGLSDEKFIPKGSYQNKLKQGEWKDYEVITDFTFCIINELPEQQFGKYLIYGEGMYRDGKREGEWVYYLIKDKTFNKILHKKVSYKKGAPVGTFTYFYPDGDVGLTGEFQFGHWHGRIQSFLPNGQNFEIINYEKGKENGPYSCFYPDGGIQIKRNYKNGINNGLTQIYYPNGNVKEDFEVKNGKLHGKYHYYYENGQLWIEKVHKNDKLMEVTGSYASNGKEREVGTLSNGNGTVKYYTKEGEVYSIITYKNGEKVNKEDLIPLLDSF